LIPDIAALIGPPVKEAEEEGKRAKAEVERKAEERKRAELRPSSRLKPGARQLKNGLPPL
jgi:hypothetical protein